MAAQQQEFEQSIVNRILSGGLPLRGGHSVFGGNGEGHRCACCDRPIVATEIQYDVELHGLPEQAVQPLSMHLHCYNAWASASGSMDRALLEASMAAAGGKAVGRRIFLIAYAYELLVKRATLLWAEGYQVVCALGNAAAQAALEGADGRYDLVIIGTGAAEQARLEMVEWLTARYPGTTLLALNPGTGHALRGLKYTANDDAPDQWLPVVAHAVDDGLCLA